MQAYSNPKKEADPYALPDLEIFYHEQGDYPDSEQWQDGDGDELPSGFYYWYCFPGCMPEGDPIGPFETEEEALTQAQEEAMDGMEEED